MLPSFFVHISVVVLLRSVPSSSFFRVQFVVARLAHWHQVRVRLALEGVCLTQCKRRMLPHELHMMHCADQLLVSVLVHVVACDLPGLPALSTFVVVLLQDFFLQCDPLLRLVEFPQLSFTDQLLDPVLQFILFRYLHLQAKEKEPRFVPGFSFFPVCSSYRFPCPVSDALIFSPTSGSRSGGAAYRTACCRMVFPSVASAGRLFLPP